MSTSPNTALAYFKIAGSTKSAHQCVSVDEAAIGAVWREQVHVPDGKGRQKLKWRWFPRCALDQKTLGRGTRAAVILGAGYASKAKAVEALVAHHAELVKSRTESESAA